LYVYVADKLPSEDFTLDSRGIDLWAETGLFINLSVIIFKLRAHAQDNWWHVVTAAESWFYDELTSNRTASMWYNPDNKCPE
jgi:hypothetical protein